jgi:hypothetical protein
MNATCRRRHIMWALALAVHGLGAANEDRRMDIGSRKQLFLDDRLIARQSNLEFRVHSPVKQGPVILPELPSEAGRVGLYGTVWPVDGKLMMWYWAFEKRTEKRHGRGLALATSSDGLHWEKPILGLVSRGGDKQNNLVSTHGDTVALNPAGPPEERFVLLRPKGFDNSANTGLFLCFSGDGIHWREQPERVFPFLPDTQNQVQFDERLGKWVAYLRGWNPGRCVVRAEIEDLKSPWPYEPLVKPRRLWGEDKPAVPSRELPTVLARDDQDPKDCDIYTPVVVRYPWADDAYFMFPSFYQHFPTPKQGGRFENDGILDIHLAVSRDGIDWQRPSRRPYIPLGEEGSPDSKFMFMFAGLVRQGDEILHYYCGYDVTHGEYHATPSMDHKGAICLARQRLDGFVSLTAGAEPGMLTTKPIQFSGQALELNLATAATGFCRVSLLGSDGKPLPGFALDDCPPLRGNSVRQRVVWNGGADLSAQAGAAVQVQIELRNADLYALQFVDE